MYLFLLFLKTTFCYGTMYFLLCILVVVLCLLRSYHTLPIRARIHARLPLVCIVWYGLVSGTWSLLTFPPTCTLLIIIIFPSPPSGSWAALRTLLSSLTSPLVAHQRVGLRWSCVPISSPARARTSGPCAPGRREPVAPASSYISRGRHSTA